MKRKKKRRSKKFRTKGAPVEKGHGNEKKEKKEQGGPKESSVRVGGGEAPFKIWEKKGEKKISCNPKIKVDRISTLWGSGKSEGKGMKRRPA